MGADGQVSLSADRLKREDCKRTKHDSVFSKWQILIGPSDWEDYSQGKEGAARYRVYNLPSRSCAGVYELGIAVSRSDAGSRLDPDDIVVVYLGQADNVRNRLQRYGRSGAHLSNESAAPGYWNDLSIDAASRQKGLHLFEEIFSRGHSLVFRWAPMKDKRDAEKTEADLLYTFDYAWNKGANGARRPGDILHKLNQVASRTNVLSNISKRLQILRQVQVGIKIESSLPIPQENVTIPSQEKSRSFLSGVFKLSRSRPRSVSDNSAIKDVPTGHICGFLMSGGIICRKPPVPGRKRCEQHKWLRISRPISNSIAEESSNYTDEEHLVSPSYQSQISTCGIILDDGAFCTRQPIPGRKRCEEHKGMRVNRCFHKPNAEDRCIDYDIRLNNAATSKTGTDDASSHDQSSSESSAKEQVSAACGAILKNGSFCRRKPGQGSTRCWQHKCKTVDSSSPRSVTLTCCVTLEDGSICISNPVPGRKRCELHKGMRAPAYNNCLESESMAWNLHHFIFSLASSSGSRRVPNILSIHIV